MFYKPPQTKVDNLEKKNFLGTSKVVASITDNDDYTGFIGAQVLDVGCVNHPDMSALVFLIL